MKRENSSRPYWVLLLGLAIVLVAPFLGSANTWSPGELVFGDELSTTIFWQIRIPRVLLGFLTGAALGCAGVAYQSLFRNPLASPYTFGIASAAAFGASSAIVFGASASTAFGIFGIPFFGIAGALLSICFILLFSRRTSSPAQMLLAGVAMSFFFSSLLLAVQYISNIQESFRIVRWLMGGLQSTGYQWLPFLLPIFCICALWVFVHHRELDAITTGEELAYSRGVDVVRIRHILFILTSIMVGAFVSYTGPIGFVGIIVPHSCRMIVGVSHRRLLPFTMFCSGCFLVFCDTLARSLLAPADIPVGIITSLLGAPFFISLLLRRNNQFLL